MVALFGVAPAGLAAVSAKAVIPLLVIGGALVLAILVWDRTFDRRSLVRLGTLPREVGRVGAIWLAAVVLLIPAVALAAPEEFLGLPRERPRLWVVIMIFYPLLSVYPQEVIFRAFFFHRYGPILGNSARLIAVNALAFGLAHAMFRNGIAVGLTTVGGALFAWTYSRTRSLPLVSLEHALYGCFIFTVGLGEYFYTGAVR
jgi:membrane protease YdiL (CAAX protease family)